jgi:tetratricopeptide (TPR) repeat protein
MRIPVMSRRRLAAVILLIASVTCALVFVRVAAIRDAKKRELRLAIKQVRNRLHHTPGSGALHFELAGLLKADGNISGYLDQMRSAVQLEPRNYIYRLSLAFTYQELGRKQLALGNYQAAARLSHEQSSSLRDPAIFNRAAAELLQELGRYAEAETTYERSLAQLSAAAFGPDGVSTQDMDSSRQAMLRQLGQVRGALAESRPTSSWVRANMPWVESDRPSDTGSAEEAETRLKECERALQTGTIGGALPHYDLGVAYLTVGRLDEAVVELLAAIELEPDRKMAWDELGWAYLLQNRLPDAAQAFDKADKLGLPGSAYYANKVRLGIRQFQLYKQAQK